MNLTRTFPYNHTELTSFTSSLTPPPKFSPPSIPSYLPNTSRHSKTHSRIFHHKTPAAITAPAAIIATLPALHDPHAAPAISVPPATIGSCLYSLS